MSSCEKCWRDSAGWDGHAERYSELLKYRDANGLTCTPEEQAGDEATGCPKCSRRTCHQWTKVCMACGWDPKRELVRDPQAACREAGEATQ